MVRLVRTDAPPSDGPDGMCRSPAMDDGCGCRPANSGPDVAELQPERARGGVVCADGRREARADQGPGSRRGRAGRECSRSAGHNNGGCSRFSWCTGARGLDRSPGRRAVARRRRARGRGSVDAHVPVAPAVGAPGRPIDHDTAGPATCSMSTTSIVDVDEFDACSTTQSASLPDRALDALRRGRSRSGAVDRSASSPTSGGRLPSRRDWPSAATSLGRGARRGADGDRPPQPGDPRARAARRRAPLRRAAGRAC